MTTKTYNNEVELTFDNGVDSGYLNFESNGVNDGTVNITFSESIGESNSSSVDKQDMIKFLEKSLEMLKQEV